MKRIGVFTFCVVFAAGCGDAYEKNEKAAKDMIAALDDIASACESVTDQASARAAAAKIEAAADRLEKIAGEVKDLPKMSKSDDEKLQKEYLPKIQAAMGRMQSAAGKLAPFSSDPAVQKAGQKLISAGMKLKAIK